MIKGFFYDTLLDEENICNLEKEKRLLQKGILSQKKLVVYGPRNSGKTSLVKNVLLPYFRKKNKKSFVLFADLMEVKTLDSIHQRIQISFEKAFSEAFPTKNVLHMAKKFLFGLRPEITMDPLTGNPSLSLGLVKERNYIPFWEILELMRKTIAPQLPSLIVLDEFQDIAFIEEAQGLFRKSLQEFQKTAMILMGSKRHILSDLFAKPNAPLASFGEDVEFGPIPYEDYYQYILERFRKRNLNIDFDRAKQLQEALFRNPEAINIVCANLYDNFSHKTIESNQIFMAIEQVVEKRRSRYEEWLGHFSQKEEEILTALSKVGTIQHPNAQVFLKRVSVSPRAINQALAKFLGKSIVEKTPEGFQLVDPLLFYFLKSFR